MLCDPCCQILIGILEVLHCILIESPEALNMIQRGHIKSIISLLYKHGRNHKVSSTYIKYRMTSVELLHFYLWSRRCLFLPGSFLSSASRSSMCFAHCVCVMASPCEPIKTSFVITCCPRETCCYKLSWSMMSKGEEARTFRLDDQLVSFSYINVSTRFLRPKHHAMQQSTRRCLLSF